MGTVPPWSVLSKALGEASAHCLGSPGPSILQRPAAWGLYNPHTLRFWGFPPQRCHLEGPESDPGPWRLTGSCAAFTQGVKVVAALVIKSSAGGAACSASRPPCCCFLMASGCWAGFWGSSCIWGSLFLLLPSSHMFNRIS